jgi:hypothetical protein
MKKSLLIALTCMALASACQSAPQSPTPTSLPTETPAPTTAPTSTPTPTPTKTPIPPTPTIEPPPVATDFLTDVRVQEVADLSNLNLWSFWNGQGSVSDGAVQVPRNGGALYTQGLPEGSAILLSYQTDKMIDWGSGLRFEAGTWMTDSFRQAGVGDGTRLKFNRTEGKQERGTNTLPDTFRLAPNTWYNMLLAMGSQAEFLVVVWNPENSTRRIEYRVPLGPKYAGLTWHFSTWTTDADTVRINYFAVLNFRGFK